ncbi:histidinol phosphate phosphatase [Jiella sp. MQZ9-1]|uniref:Histidinol phosphate phosphatase n=1 Tax=Jiella flava TaxID=2816857 RepID=A0A939JVG5_9HYPH|nr:inositol monophosphatase family protein [Jiella flava]MBO0662434.1 histidinol phosphate phosphatase [Jiella flava]MCD2471657.1 histidinol phosphate phosphatase [Jiella flava]
MPTASPNIAATDWNDFADFAGTLCNKARPIALGYFRTALPVDSKADESPVTIADRTIEAEMRAMIEAHFPSHGIYGEEFGIKNGDEHIWVLDPIDGTKSFITGFPLFGTLVSLAVDGAPRIGVIDIPATGERWIGTPGETRLAGAKQRTNDCRALDAARLYTTSPDGFTTSNTAGALAAMSARVAMRRFGGDCYIYGLLASGYCDLVLEVGLQPYDFMALVPVIEGAGGVITDWCGEPLGFESQGRVIAAATPDLHADAIDFLRIWI